MAYDIEPYTILEFIDTMQAFYIIEQVLRIFYKAKKLLLNFILISKAASTSFCLERLSSRTEDNKHKVLVRSQ